MADIPVKIIVNATDNATSTIKGVGKSFDDLSGNVQKVALAGAAIGGMTILLAKGFLEQAGAMEQNQVAFEVMLGSAEKANTLLKEMTEFAARTPFNLPEIINAGKQLLAYGFAQEEVIKTTEMLGNVASGLNIPMGDIIYLFGTLRAQGRAYTKDLNQFTARGIPILDALAKQYGVTKEAVFDLASEGKIGFADVEKAFQGMTNEGGIFFKLMDKQSKTTMGTWANFQDSLTRVQITLGNALLPAAIEVMKTLGPLVDKFGQWAKENPELVRNLVIAGLAIGAISAVLIAIGVIVPPIIAAFAIMGTILGGIITVVTAVGTAFGFIVAVLGGPITLIILAIIALVGFLALAWRNNWFDIQGKVQEAGTFISNAITGLITFLQGLWDFVLSLPQVFTAFVESLRAGIYVFFTETLPFAIGFLAGRLVKFVTEDIPAFINNAIQWFSQLPGRIGAFLSDMYGRIVSWFTQAKDNAITSTTNLVNNVVDWISTLPGKISDWLSKLPGIVAQWFNDAKDQAIGIAKDLYNGVKEWFDKVIGFFKDIVDWAGKAIGKAGEAASAGYNAGKRQFGGPVNSMQPYMVGEAGPEMFVPQTAGKVVPAHQSGQGAGGGPVIQFIINSSMIINSPTERRSLAEALYKDLVTLARSQNMSVADMLGG